MNINKKWQHQQNQQQKAKRKEDGIYMRNLAIKSQEKTSPAPNAALEHSWQSTAIGGTAGTAI